MKSLGSAVSKVAAPALGRRGFGEAQMIFSWRSIVGSALASDTLPVKLSFPHNQRTEGVLHLRVASGAAPTVQHLEPAILERINSYFGYRAVARLALRQGPLPRRPERDRDVADPALPAAEAAQLRDAVAGVESGELRLALERLGTHVIAGQGRLASRARSR
jgi:hypothetical protein